MDEHLWPVLAAAERDDLEPLIQLLNDKSIDWVPDQSWPVERFRQSVHDELLLSGGHTLGNIVRHGGPHWSEIVSDVAVKVKTKVEATDTVETLEQKVAIRLLERAVEGMTPEQISELREQLEEAGVPKDIPIGSGALVAALVAGRIGGFASYMLLTSVANTVAGATIGSLSFAANAGLMRALGIALGPLGMAMTTAITAIGIGGPAYRITVRSVILIAALRARQRQLPSGEAQPQVPT